MVRAFFITSNPLQNDKFYSSKLKEFADNNFEFDENGKQLKTLWEEEKLLNTGKLSLSQSGFLKVLLRTCKKHIVNLLHIYVTWI